MVNIAPTSVLVQTNLSGTLEDIDESPDSPDAGWMAAIDQGSNTDVRVGFPTPATSPTGTQTIRVLVRKNAEGGSTPTAVVELWEAGTLRATVIPSEPVTDPVGVILSGTFDASVLATPSGEDVEIRVNGVAPGGKPADRRSIGIGAIEWQATLSADIRSHPSTVAGGGGGVASGRAVRRSSALSSGGGGVVATTTTSRSGAALVAGGGGATVSGGLIVAGTATVAGGGDAVASGFARFSGDAAVPGGGGSHVQYTATRQGVGVSGGGGSVTLSSATFRYGSATVAGGGEATVFGSLASTKSAVVAGGGDAVVVIRTVRHGAATVAGGGDAVPMIVSGAPQVDLRVSVGAVELRPIQVEASTLKLVLEAGNLVWQIEDPAVAELAYAETEMRGYVLSDPEEKWEIVDGTFRWTVEEPIIDR